MTAPRKLQALKTAIELIALDNGAVRSDQPMWHVMCRAWFALRERYTLSEIHRIEDDLAALSPALLETVCTDEMPVPMPISTLTQEALNHVFNNLP